MPMVTSNTYNHELSSNLSQWKALGIGRLNAFVRDLDGCGERKREAEGSVG